MTRLLVLFLKRKPLIVFVVINWMVAAVIVLHSQNSTIPTDGPEQHQWPPESRQMDWKSMDVGKLSAEQIIEYFNWSNRTSCKLTHDFGGLMRFDPGGLDCQRAVCLDKSVAPNDKDGLVYSFGINNEWSFDEAMEDYGCRVFAFDPSMVRFKEHFNYTEGIEFRRIGLDEKDHVDKRSGWTLKSLDSIYTMLGHEGRIIDYLKLDIEGYEWKVLPQIIRTGMMKKVRQLGVEIHMESDKSIDYYRSLAGIVKQVEDAGFVRFDSKYNPWTIEKVPALNYEGATCFDLAWYQTI